MLLFVLRLVLAWVLIVFLGRLLGALIRIGGLWPRRRGAGRGPEGDEAGRGSFAFPADRVVDVEGREVQPAGESGERGGSAKVGKSSG